MFKHHSFLTTYSDIMSGCTNHSTPAAITEIRRGFHWKNFGRLMKSRIFATNYNPSDKKRKYSQMYQDSRFYIHVAAFWVVTTFIQVGGYHSLEGIYCFHLPHRGVEFYLEGGGRMYPKMLITIYLAACCQKLDTTWTLEWYSLCNYSTFVTSYSRKLHTLLLKMCTIQN